MKEAVSTARAYAAAANATRSPLDNAFGAMAISVAEWKPAIIGSLLIVHIVNALGSRDPVGTGRLADKQIKDSPLRGNSHPLLFCSVGLNGCSALTIIDTGAACTVVRSKFCPEVRPYQQELRTANGTVLQTKGSSRINVTIGNKTVPQEVCDSDAISWDDIICLDLLVRAGCTIDLQWRMLRVGEEHVKLPSGRPLTEKPNPDLWSLEVAPVNLQAQVDSFLTSCNREVSEEAVEQLKAVVPANESAIAWDGAPPGRSSRIQHRINTGESVPLRQPPRRIPALYRDQVSKIIDDMLARDVIQPSTSPWASPVVLVNKKWLTPIVR
ncbi:hypothetical protein EG68_07837 [Paragonimus skrjabini miyazakii]|uniref:Peptidase A2 domain-containing protein n=1 Tax=Paragonimus skrjabini miyazakii TaxID=59628 RepID=A0A8S9YKP5_9TREM|nr:hypothetical protein EG68_07837 [Paragonimus skrjabini miyazakii]